MAQDLQPFFSACLSAGAILTGFCGTFLSFRIQREANYYRQPAVDFKSGESRDIYINLSHFTSSFLLLMLASLLSVACGFVLPLLALAGMAVSKQIVVAGMTAGVVFVAAYFICEMVHYGVLNRRLLNDSREWGRSRGIVTTAILVAAVSAVAIFRYL
jgi:hypothetical protein